MSSPLISPNTHTHTITVDGPKEMVEAFIGELAVVVYKENGQIKGRIQFDRKNPMLSMTILNMVTANMLPVLAQHMEAMVKQFSETRIFQPSPGMVLPPAPEGKGHA